MNGAANPLPLLSSIDTLIFAGGGNRCWWQAGVMHEWMVSGKLHATRYVGTSAGAGIAYAAATGRIEDALTACKRLYANNPKVIASLRPLEFAHTTIYPAWVQSFADEASLDKLRRADAPQVWVGMTRLPNWLPMSVALLIGAAAYMADKYFGKHIHPKMLPRLGYRMQILPVDETRGASDARELMQAAAAAPPFMPAQMYAGSIAVDGGFADNAPRIALAHNNERQLVLLTRHYPNRPPIFELEGRWYFQPSKKIAVSTWDCTPKADVDGAFEHGRADAKAQATLMDSMRI